MNSVYSDNKFLTTFYIILFIFLLFFDCMVITLSFFVRTTKKPRLFYLTINVLISNVLLILSYEMNFFTHYKNENGKKKFIKQDLCNFQAIILAGFSLTVDIIVFLISIFSYNSISISSDYSLDNLSKKCFYSVIILPYICPLFINLIIGLITTDYEFNEVFCFASSKKIFNNKVSLDIFLLYGSKYILFIITIIYILKIIKFLKKKSIKKEKFEAKIFIFKRFSLLIIQIIGALPATLIRTVEIIKSKDVKPWEFWVIIITYNICGFLFAIVYLWISGLFYYFCGKKNTYDNNNKNAELDETISEICLSDDTSKENELTNGQTKEEIKKWKKKV